MNHRFHHTFAIVASAMIGFAAPSAAVANAPAEAGPVIGLGTPFGDHAVLQRGMPAPVWGWSKPGTEVTVEFAGQKKPANAAKNGRWSLSLDSLEVSAEPRDMPIDEKGGASRILKPPLVGEVWMASGQSNKQWLASKCDVGMVLQKQIAVRLALHRLRLLS